jgi:predicted  nucleic acid-binding Zn-ribbon protein
MKKVKTKTIKKDQLEKIVAQQKDLNVLLTNIGVLETQKHSLLHQVAEVNKEVEDFKSELESEYGAININLEDGSYTEIEKEEDNG